MKVVINSLILLLIFTSSAVLLFLTSYPYDIEGLSHGARLVLLFGVVFLMTAGYTRAFDHRLSPKTILITILIPFLVFIMAYLFLSSVKNTVKTSPLYITWILGFVAGIIHHRNGFQLKSIALLALFPVIMAFNLYDLWMHKIEYGNLTGYVEQPEIIPFEFLDKEGAVVSNEDLKGKVVLLDFWFISCPPCWKSFPEIQRIYTEYKDHPSFALYAINRSDDPDKLFNAITENGYTFPVLRGPQDDLDALGVYYYPTVILLNRKGEVIYRGEIENAESMIKDLLED